MQTKTKSKDWTDALFQNVDDLKIGDDSITWVYDFLGWNKYAKGRTKGNR